MAKIIGIDYGAKRVGIAVSDERGSIAFPKTTLPTDARLVASITELIKEEGVSLVVVGDSRQASGEDNHIMEAVRQFVEKLKESADIPVEFEQEYYTSVQARRDTGRSYVDAEAAAILLNSYIVRTQHND